MTTIALEEHFVTRASLEVTHGYVKGAPAQMVALLPRLLDLDEGRIAAMDEAGVDVQVLSLAAIGFDELDAEAAIACARETNDSLAAATRKHPTRFAGFAALPLKDPAAAVTELDRCVTQLGFVGALLDGTVDGVFLDDPRFLPVFEKAVELNVPVYLHPAPPPAAVRAAYFAGLPPELAMPLATAGWGWHAETGLHTLRLIVSGLFDKLPTLQLIIGHMGEGIPYALARSSGILSAAAPHLRQPVAAYFHTNLHITTSGYFTEPPLRCALDALGPGAIDRLMFSVDYPFSANTRGRGYLDQLAKTLSAEDLAKFAEGNAQRLLRLGTR